MLKLYRNHTLKRANNKGTDQTVWMRRLVYTFIVGMKEGQVLYVASYGPRRHKNLLSRFVNIKGADQPVGIAYAQTHQRLCY